MSQLSILGSKILLIFFKSEAKEYHNINKSEQNIWGQRTPVTRYAGAVAEKGS